MALRNQPYIPLYIQDIMTDEKLNECSASTHGIYIKGIMCLMHKSEFYGKILLKQNHKQTGSTCLDFGNQLTKHLPYTAEEIAKAIDELLREKVCYLDGDYLCQKRMIRDNEISEMRSMAGKKGGGNPAFVKTIPQTNLQTNLQTNTEDESEYESKDVNESEIVIKKEEIPFEEILNLFHSILPQLPKVIKLSDQRKVAVSQRWLEYPNISDFKNVFEIVSKSDFLMGIKTEWKADFDFIMKKSKFLKILEGSYSNVKNGKLLTNKFDGISTKFEDL